MFVKLNTFGAENLKIKKIFLKNSIKFNKWVGVKSNLKNNKKIYFSTK